MSIEFQLAFACPHEMVREPAMLSSNGVTLQTSHTVVGGVKVYMNDREIPPEGLQTPAKLLAGAPGAYRVYPDARTFGITYKGMTKEIELSVGLHTTASLAHTLSKLFDGVVVSDKDGRLLFEDRLQLGIGSRISLSGDSLETLGFSGQRASSGKEIAPPWGIGLRDGYMTVSYPRFFYPVKQRNNNRFEVTYTTEANRCRRCMATRVENDVRVDGNGYFQMIRDEDHLYQSCLKALLTGLGSNPQHRWYGSQIMKMVGKKGSASAGGIVADEIRRVLDTHSNLQTQQAKYQTVTTKERLYRVVDVQVQQHRKDPTTFMCKVVVQNFSGAPVSLSIVYTAPGASSLVRRDGVLVNSMGSF